MLIQPRVASPMSQVFQILNPSPQPKSKGTYAKTLGLGQFTVAVSNPSDVTNPNTSSNGCRSSSTSTVSQIEATGLSPLSYSQWWIHSVSPDLAQALLPWQQLISLRVHSVSLHSDRVLKAATDSEILQTLPRRGSPQPFAPSAHPMHLEWRLSLSETRCVAFCLSSPAVLAESRIGCGHIPGGCSHSGIHVCTVRPALTSLCYLSGWNTPSPGLEVFLTWRILQSSTTLPITAVTVARLTLTPDQTHTTRSRVFWSSHRLDTLPAQLCPCLLYKLQVVQFLSIG